MTEKITRALREVPKTAQVSKGEVLESSKREGTEWLYDRIMLYIEPLQDFLASLYCSALETEQICFIGESLVRDLKSRIDQDFDVMDKYGMQPRFIYCGGKDVGVENGHKDTPDA